ncbi:MAG TPA: hypothetical protein VK654_04930 [Nitrospirota bacterium]|nr:hypothetical protein [Nitrospirota bacterium]
MLKKSLAVLVIALLAVSFAACKKNEQQAQPQLPAGHPPMQGGMPPAGMGAPSGPKVERTVVVSKEIAAKWKAVRLSVENRASKTTKEYQVAVGSELPIPDTKMTVKVLAFLPDFKMTDKEFYSATDKPNQPAAQVTVSENGKEIWNNWLFSMQPTIHPFQHENIGIILLGGVAK